MSMSHPISVIRTTPLGWSTRTDPVARSRSPRRVFQVALGLLWLLDAALQFQPYMFTDRFVRQIVLPAAQGNPGWIATTETWAASMMAQHIVVYNALFATIQLLLATLILWKPTVKIGLGVSATWALGVWWFGEGLGGVLSGASPLAGAPGAVVLYALIALLAWPRSDGEAGTCVSSSALLRWHLPRLAWMALWGSLSYLLVLPANRGSVPGLLSAMAAGEPGWLAGIDHHLAAGVAGEGTAVSIVLAACCAFVAASVFAPTLRRHGVVLAILLGLAFWLAEDFGAVLTGQGTDPNSGPLLVLLAFAFWPYGATTPRSSDARSPSGQVILMPPNKSERLRKRSRPPVRRRPAGPTAPPHAAMSPLPLLHLLDSPALRQKRLHWRAHARRRPRTSPLRPLRREVVSRHDTYGGGEGTRTLGLRLAKPPLFQLSYTPGLSETTSEEIDYFSRAPVRSSHLGKKRLDPDRAGPALAL
jgi:hypothetical protein